MQYWHGNAAKTRIMERISALAAQRELTVIDLGCGGGGDWPAFLANHPGVSLHAYEPDSKQATVAAARLASRDADVHTGARPTAIGVLADVIVSLSVFEHVWDRRLYLQDAKALLAPSGVFFLNYDDGHFRPALQLDLPKYWPGELRTALENLRAKTWAKKRRFDRYQSRVDRAELDLELLPEVGFRCEETFYSNLRDIKLLYRSIPAERRPAFVRSWVEFETKLNEDFRTEGLAERGDPTNLWQVMPSRTLVLRHADGAL